MISTLEALAILVALKLKFGDRPDSDGTMIYMKSREMRTVVEWAPREWNKEADQLANGSTELFDPAKRLEVAARTLSWSILPEALAAGREAERSFQEMKQTIGLPCRSQKQRKRRVETRLKITDPW